MKTFIPHVYFSAPEDTVGDLVNQIRRESEIPHGRTEAGNEGQRQELLSRRRSFPLRPKRTPGRPIEQLHKEPEAIPGKPEENRTAGKTRQNPSFRRRSFPLRKASLTAFMTC